MTLRPILLAFLILPFLCGFGWCQSEYLGNADLDGNGIVDSEDLILMMDQWKTDGSASLDSALPQNQNLPSSLHRTPRGMDYFYSRADGFGPMIGVDYQTLACKNCHVNKCSNCHDQPNGTYKAQNSCLTKCHSRQNTEVSRFKFTDVHNEIGFTCGTCHTTEQFHGDGTVYASMHSPGAPSISCANCHIISATDSSIPEHKQHLDSNGKVLECGVCHIQSVITCYNCHFDSEINGLGKINYSPMSNFVMLVNVTETNRVGVASYQSLYHNATDKSFVVFAPFHSHSVTRQGRTCGGCHNNKYAQARNAGGDVVVTEWVAGAIKHATGVIPVIDGAMTFQYVNLTNPTAPPAERVWEPVKTTSDGVQYGFCAPLSATQTALLAAPFGGR